MHNFLLYQYTSHRWLLYLGIITLVSYDSFQVYLFYEEAVVIYAYMKRSQCRVSVTQVAVKAYGPLVWDVIVLYRREKYTETCLLLKTNRVIFKPVNSSSMWIETPHICFSLQGMRIYLCNRNIPKSLCDIILEFLKRRTTVLKKTRKQLSNKN